MAQSTPKRKIKDKKETWADLESGNGNNSYLQGQKCVEGISRKQRTGGCRYHDDIV